MTATLAYDTLHVSHHLAVVNLQVERLRRHHLADCLLKFTLGENSTHTKVRTVQGSYQSQSLRGLNLRNSSRERSTGKGRNADSGASAMGTLKQLLTPGMSLLSAPGKMSPMRARN